MLISRIAFGAALAVVVLFLALPQEPTANAQDTAPPKGWNWVCRSVGSDYVDPIVSPYTYPTPHRHDFMGALVKPDTTNALKLRRLENNCRWAFNDEEEGDQSAYWQPSPQLKSTGEWVRTPQANIYIRMPRGVEPEEVRPPPSGLKYLVGSPDATGAQDKVLWRCPDGKGQGTPVDCTGESENVKISYFVPTCSNGQKDSANHKDHLTWPVRGECPSSHPRPIPAINMSFGIRTPNANDIEFVMKNGPMAGMAMSPHADFFNGTTQTIWLKWIDLCMQSPEGGCAGTGIPGKKNPV